METDLIDRIRMEREDHDESQREIAKVRRYADFGPIRPKITASATLIWGF